MLDCLSTIQLSFFDTTGPINQVGFSLNSIGSYLNEAFMDEAYMEGLSPVRIVLEHFEKNIIGIAISTAIEHTSASENFQVYYIDNMGNSLKGKMPIALSSIN